MLVDQLLAKQPNLKVLFMSGYDDRQVVQRYVVGKGLPAYYPSRSRSNRYDWPSWLKCHRRACEHSGDAGHAERSRMTKTARRWFVSGRVQGVGFRWFVQNEADRLGLRGWVRNEDDGRVQVYAIGSPEQLDELARAPVSRAPHG